MELKIYDKQGSVMMTVSPDDSSRWNHEVGVENVVTVNFTTWEFLVFEVGWYILVEGHRFSIKAEYRPKHIHNSRYSYNLKFYGREHDTQDILFCRLNQGEDDLESVFAYDGTPLEFLNKVVANMNRNSDGIEWKAGDAVTANRKTINFNGLYCWDALAEIARSFGVEWWIDGTIINLNKCIRGESISLGYGEGLKSGLTQKENTNAIKWFTRLIPIGSTRNIDRNKYGYANLQLPDRKKYIDINNRYGLKEYREEAAFSDIYPHRVGTISSVRSDVRINEDTGDYTVYYVKDSDLPFNPDEYMLGGEVIHMTFNTGALAGKEFEVNWNVTTQEFEIINQYPDETSQLPGGNLIPSVGDSYVLSNISMPDEYNTIAEDAFQKAVEDYLDEYDMDISIYTGDTDYIYVEKNNIPLMLGQRVSLVSEQYFETGYRDSRITRVSRKLNNLGEASIDCSNSVSSSWIQKLGSNINNVTVSQRSDQKKISKNEKDIEDLYGLWELRKNDQGDKYLYTPYNVLTALGFTSYSTGRGMRFPSIYDGLPIDNQTLYWEETTNDDGSITRILKARGGSSGDGIVGQVTWNNITGKPLWLEDGKISFDEIEGAPDMSLYATQEWVTDLINNSGGSGGGTDSGSLSVNSSGDGNAFTSYTYVNGVLTFIKGSTFALQSDLNTLLGVVTNKLDKSTFETWKSVNESLIANGNTAYGWGNHADAGYLTSHQTIYNLTMKSGSFSATTFDPNGAAKTVNIPTTTDHITEGSNLFFTEERVTNALGDTLSNYVDLTSSQTIKGQKDFTGGLLVNGVELVYDKTNKYWKLEGDLLVTGGITSFASDTAFTSSTIMDALVLDSSTLAINNEGQLTVIGGTGGGTVDSVAWGDITGKPSWIGSTKPSYSWTEITSKPSWIGSSKPTYSYSEITGTPTSLKNPYALTFGSKSYDGSVPRDITASDLGALTSHQTIHSLSLSAGTFTAASYNPASEPVSIKIPTSTNHISEGTKLFFTNQRAIDALKDTLTNYVDLTTNQEIDGEKNFIGSLMVNGSKIEYNAEDGYWKFNGNMLITGGLTTYSTDGYESPFMVDAASIDLITSKSTTQVYTARATKLIKDKVITVGTDASSALAKLATIKSELASITDTSLISVIRDVLINIRERI